MRKITRAARVMDRRRGNRSELLRFSNMHELLTLNFTLHRGIGVLRRKQRDDEYSHDYMFGNNWFRVLLIDDGVS